jgi:arsenite-transporting ATPase
MASPAAETGLQLGRQRILFVGGKGGVGKTTTASALGLHLSEQGDRCLIVSTDPAHSLGDLWDRSIGDKQVLLAPNLWGLELDPDAQVQSYLDTVKETMRDLVKPHLYPQIDRQMELARLSPGAVEAAMLERMADLMLDRDSRFDRIIFDTAPTGHTLRLLSLPDVMAAWTDGLLGHRDRSQSHDGVLKTLRPQPGVSEELDARAAAADREDERSSRIRSVLIDRRDRFHRAKHILLDSEVSAFILVLIPEKLPILESRKALETLRHFGIPILGMVVNRVLPADALGGFLEDRREQEAVYLQQIDESFRDLPKVRIPMLKRDIEGSDSLRWIADRLLSGP